MSARATVFPSWLTEWMEASKIVLWGGADLRGFATPLDEAGCSFPNAISFAVPMDRQVMAGITGGPNQAYADEYARVNDGLNGLAKALAERIRVEGFQAKPLAASERTDPLNIRGDFPHKTAATRAGLGWIGRHCQLITRRFGPWIRLGTIFTNMEVPTVKPAERSHCGSCTRCVDACPAKALKGKAWYPGLAREEMLDALACDQWKKEHYFQYHKGHTCGICAAVCPYGLSYRRR